MCLYVLNEYDYDLRWPTALITCISHMDPIGAVDSRQFSNTSVYEEGDLRMGYSGLVYQHGPLTGLIYIPCREQTLPRP
jgi:hypothetical protein